jgi:hypothetical protein
MVAVPTETTAATRIPARITGKASGSSTRRSRCPSVIPRPVAASHDPRVHLRDAGDGIAQDRKERVGDEGHERGPRADPADGGSGIRKPKSARLGMVCTRLARASTGRARRSLRASRIPRGRPMPTHAIRVEARTSTTCWPTRARSSARRSARNARKPLTGAPPPGRAGRRWPRLRPHLAGSPDLDDAPLVHHREAIGEAEGLGHVVGHEHDALAEPLLQLLEVALHLPAGQGIERAEGLVHQQEWGIGAQRPRDPHPLALASGELRGPEAGEAVGVEPDQGQHLADAGMAPSPRPSPGARERAPRSRPRSSGGRGPLPGSRSRSGGAERWDRCGPRPRPAPSPFPSRAVPGR